MVWKRECPHCNQLLQYVYVEDIYRSTPCEYDEHVRFALTELTRFSGNCTQILTILYGLAKSKNCLRQVAEEAGVSIPLVSRIKKDITGRIKEWLWKSCSNVIGGFGRVVEIDEAQLGRRKNHRGKERRCEWVLGMIERGSNRISLASVIRRTTKEMYPLILERVLPDNSLSIGSKLHNHPADNAAPKNIDRLGVGKTPSKERIRRKTSNDFGHEIDIGCKYEDNNNRLGPTNNNESVRLEAGCCVDASVAVQ
ncbi:uncharacterized protein LOC134814679 [Bolinopsis microptera]|uniref:uncharacterized protein LOC134814679 n=1 Tax=Bolinopsis microptera TaxID=2820187 RepID=UPI00307A28FD